MSKENMSKETNKGFVINFKTITTNLLTILGLIVEPIIPLAKTAAYLKVYLSIRQPP